MKKIFVLCISLSLVAVTFAQLDIGISLAFPREFNNLCNSAAVASGVTYFNTDMIDTLNDESVITFPVTSAHTYVSTDAGSSWLSPIAMANVGGIYYPDTWQSSRTNAASGSVEYYFKCETESTLTTECPDNNPTSFPLDNNKSVQIGDVTGDQEDVDGYTYSSVDITDFYVSWDTDEFFFKVNLGSGWKDMHMEGPFPFRTTYYHMLTIPIINNESSYRDSLFFGVVIGNVNVFGIINIYDGIYKFWTEDGDDDSLNNFRRLGDVTCSPSNPDDDSEFSVRVPISVLTSNGWGIWPNSSRAIGTGCSTMSFWIESIITLAYNPVVTDVTKSSGMICQTHTYNIGTNTIPTLSPTHSADYERDTTWFDLSCTYTDSNDNLPTLRQLTIDDGSSTTYTVGNLDHSYTDGSLFEYSAIYGCEHLDSLRYKWDFDDGAGIVSTGWIYAVLAEVAIELSSGWNLISLLCINPQSASIFGSSAYSYDNSIGSYYMQDSLNPGIGYWILSTSADTVLLNKDLYSYSDTLFPGWNLIGAKNSPIPANIICTEPPGLSSSLPYGWNGVDYYDADSLFPGHGYWFLSSGHGRIIVGP